MTYECSLCFCLKFGFGLQTLYLSSKPKVLKLIDLSNPFNSEGQFLICIVPSGSKLICLQNKGKHWQQQKKLVSVILLEGRPLNQNFFEKLLTNILGNLSVNNLAGGEIKMLNSTEICVFISILCQPHLSQNAGLHTIPMSRYTAQTEKVLYSHKKIFIS